MSTSFKPLALLLFLLAIPAIEAQKPVDHIVYRTRTGDKYHRVTCRYVLDKKLSLKLSQAKKAKLKACKVCRPPTK